MSEWFQLLVSIHFMTFLFSNSLVLSKLALNRLFLLIMIGELLRMCVPDAGVWGVRFGRVGFDFGDVFVQKLS